MKEIVLDTETTGLSVKDGHRIVEIGCIELDDLIPTKKVFHCYLNPERKVSESALKVHGYTDIFLSNKKKFKEIVEDFLEFIEGDNTVLESNPLEKVTSLKEIKAFKHEGFWQCMDHKLDKDLLDKMVKDKKAPWIK